MSKTEAIERALAENDEFPLGFFLVYEGFGADGMRVLHYVYSDDIAYWQALGMLQTATESLHVLLGEDEEDEPD